MKKLILFSILSILMIGCSKEEENIDYAKQVVGKYKTKTLNSNGILASIPDNVEAYHVITYRGFNKVDLLQDFPNGSSSLYNIDVNNNNLSCTLSDSKFEGSVNGNTLTFTLTMYTGEYVSCRSVK
jgi:uncharacterized membrane protein